MKHSEHIKRRLKRGGSEVNASLKKPVVEVQVDEAADLAAAEAGRLIRDLDDADNGCDNDLPL